MLMENDSSMRISKSRRPTSSPCIKLLDAGVYVDSEPGLSAAISNNPPGQFFKFLALGMSDIPRQHHQKASSSKANPISIFAESKKIMSSLDKEKVDHADKRVGESEAMAEVRNLILKIAASSAAVLIEGKSGNSKEIATKAILLNGPRRNMSFIAVNCSAMLESLLENELFGHEAGVFT